MTVLDLDQQDASPIVVQRARGLPDTDDGWETIKGATANKLRRAAGNDIGSAELEMVWGEWADPNEPEETGLDIPDPPLDVDDCIRLVVASYDDGEITFGEPLFHGYVESIDWGDAKRATLKVVDLAGLPAKIYTTRGWELNYNATLLSSPGYLPAFNAIPGGDRSASLWTGTTYYVHDRRGDGTATSWTAFQIGELLLRRAMKEDLPGAPPTLNQLKWRMDPASAGDYTPDTTDLNAISIGEALDKLFGARRGLTWRVTVADGYAQILVIDISAGGTSLDTQDDLGWTDPVVQDRRDGYDYILVSGSQPRVGITLWWKRGTTGGAIEPDGWDPATADAALDAALEDEKAGKPYDRPEWRRFRLRSAWDGSQYDGTAGGSGTIGLRNALSDTATNAPPDGTREFAPGNPPPNSLTIEGQLPAGLGFTTSLVGPRQGSVVIAGAANTWQDLSQDCPVTPICGSGDPGDRNDRGASVILLGNSAEDADKIRQAVGATGTLLVTVAIREWAPLQCAWAAPADSWSKLALRKYALRRPGLEEWICLSGCITGIDDSCNLTTLSAELDIRSDVAKLQDLTAQLAVRFGRAIVGVTITRQGEILTDWEPGDVLADITTISGRNYLVGMPLAEISYDFVKWETALRWSPMLKETPSA